ncbi:hypothetical protein ACE0DR_06815 [Azotobacter sp. CWF10]
MRYLVGEGDGRVTPPVGGRTQVADQASTGSPAMARECCRRAEDGMGNALCG